MSNVHQNNPETDPQKLWQNQPREETPMTLEMIHLRAQELHARNRRELIGSIVSIPVVIATSWFGFLHTQNPIYQSAFAGSVFWAILGQYLLHQGMWSAPRPERSGLMPGLEYYRREIDRRRNVLGRVLQWSFGPIILCIVTLILLLTGMARGAGKPGAALPFATLFVIWMVGFFVLRSRTQRELKQEIDELNRIEDGERTKSS